MKLWLTVEEAAPYIGDTPDAIWRDIREGQFPFQYVKSGNRIKISAWSIGLIPTLWGELERQPNPRNSEAQRSEQAVVATV